ncbi:MAG: ATP-binding protein [Steroidobacteraceae bacterium]
MRGQLTLSVVVRALLIGLLAFLLVYLLTATHLYATTLIVALLIILVGVDLARTIARAEYATERFLEALAADVIEVPVQRFAGLTRLAAPFARAASAIQARRSEQRVQLEYLQALLDTVSSALIVLHSGGRVILANRAARKLAAESLVNLQEIVAIGPQAADEIRTLAPGARQVVRLAAGYQVLASMTQFSVPGKEAARLLSLQRISGELDAVELKAWQDMTRVLAHEMMNSLTPISSLSESLEALFQRKLRDTPIRDAASGEIAEALEAIKRRSLGLLSFVERYRQVAELPKPRLQSIQMHAFLMGMVRLVSATLNDSGIACRVEVKPLSLAIQADPELLEQALLNLIRNAVDAVAEVAAPELAIGCEAGDTRVVITIADNGCGLPGVELEQIFVPFFTTKVGGSGIGLSLARQVALAHGGQLDVRAGQPQGSVFRMELPVVLPRHPAD